MSIISMKIRTSSQILFLLFCFFSVQSLSAKSLAFNTIKWVTIPDRLIYTGSIEAINSSTVSAQTSGRVVKTFFDVGDLVAKDALLVQLRDNRQRATLDQAKAQLHAAQAQSDRANKEFTRIVGIFKKNLVSKNDYDRALSQQKSAKEQVKAAAANVKNAQEQYDFTKIKAPYSGIVQKRLVEVGESVQPGMPLYSGMSLDALRVKVEVPQKDISNLRKYKSARILLPDGSYLSITAKDMTFFAYANPINATFTIRLKLPQQIKNLYPGMFLKTEFTQGERKVMQIPRTSIIHRGELTAVYINQGDHILLRQIMLGSNLGNGNIEVISGLFEGDRVILNPIKALELIKLSH